MQQIQCIKIAPDIQKNINIPILHIAEATADELDKKNIKKVAPIRDKIYYGTGFL